MYIHFEYIKKAWMNWLAATNKQRTKESWDPNPFACHVGINIISLLLLGQLLKVGWRGPQVFVSIFKAVIKCTFHFPHQNYKNEKRNSKWIWIRLWFYKPLARNNLTNNAKRDSCILKGTCHGSSLSSSPLR